jgi:hypothetical protein
MDMATGSVLPSRGLVTVRRDLLAPIVEKPVGTPETRIASVIVTAVTVIVIVTATLRLSERIVVSESVVIGTRHKHRTGDMLKPRTTWQLPSWVMPGHFVRLKEDNSSTRKTSWSGFRRRNPRTSHLHC